MNAQSQGLSADTWLRQFRKLGADEGFFEPLGRGHVASFQDHGDTLLISFDSLPRLRQIARGRPLGFEMSRHSGWSALNVVALQDGFFRTGALDDFFTQLQADGFFAAFDTVLFCGTGFGGYAACSYARACPDARVLALAPVATQDPMLASWDMRTIQARRLDYNGPYGYAPHGVLHTDAAHVVFDPFEAEDAMHAALMATSGAHLHRMPHLGSHLDLHLRRMRLMAPLLTHLADGSLDDVRFAKLFRTRRRYKPYLLELVDFLGAQNRMALATKLCRHLMAHHNMPELQGWLNRFDT